MQKLVYENYKSNDNILSIDLHNGYSVIVIKTWHKNERYYSIELFLKENTISKWDLIDDISEIRISSNYKYINSAILKKIAVLLKEGFFNHYINRYEYEMNCFEIGNEISEKKG